MSDETVAVPKSILREILQKLEKIVKLCRGERLEGE